MVVVMIVYKGKKETINVAIFSKNSTICIVRQHFVNAVH